MQQGWRGQTFCFIWVEFTFTKGAEVRVSSIFAWERLTIGTLWVRFRSRGYRISSVRILRSCRLGNCVFLEIFFVDFIFNFKTLHLCTCLYCRGNSWGERKHCSGKTSSANNREEGGEEGREKVRLREFWRHFPVLPRLFRIQQMFILIEKDSLN